MPEVVTTRCLSCGDAFAGTPPYREACPRCMLIGGADAMETEAAVTPTESLPGTVIDNYILREKIGEGGFGIVYRAEQTAPVKREVALKVIKRGMDTDEVVARFSAERQALALMDHPNVSTVFDAGATPGGRPYFVMELVDGEPITAFCDHHGLGVRERLELFIDVCHAVQHAHQKGILHRDLKPSNVLVKHASPPSTPDTRPSSLVKVIDFGVAKALHAELTEETLYTAEGRLLGTPEYMSPEQTGGVGSGDDIDTRSDVYALGVLLYELLAGATPLDSARLRSASFGEMERLIREVDPPKPSVRAEDQALARQLRGDLDWIALKAIEKDRERRYATAEDLGSDVARHLSHKPVVARPPTTAYRLQKFARRNRALVTGVAAVVAAGLAVAAGMRFFLSSDQRDLSDPRKLPLSNKKTVDIPELMIAAGEHREALEVLTKAIADNPRNPEFLRLRALCFNALERWDECLDDLDAAVDLAPEERKREYRGYRATIYGILNGKWKNAAADMRELLYVNEGEFAGWQSSRDIALVLGLAGDIEGYRIAVAEMEKRFENEPDYVWLTITYFMMPGMVSKANIGRLVTAADHPSVVVKGTRAAFLYRIGRFREAEQLFSEMPLTTIPNFQFINAMTWHQLGEEDHAKKWLEIGNAAVEQRFEDGVHGVIPTGKPWPFWAAILILQREANALILGTPVPGVPTVARQHPSVHESKQLIAAGNHGEAVDVLTKAIEESPGDPDLRHLSAVCSNRLERWDECLAQLNTAVECAPEEQQDEFKRYRALLYWIPNGEWEKAASDMEGLAFVGNADSAVWHFRELALVQLLAGDMDSFRVAFVEMERLFEESPAPNFRERLTRTYLLAPGLIHEQNRERLFAPCAEQATFRFMTQAALLYRCDQFAEAGKIFSKHPTTKAPDFYFIAAMTWHRLGDTKCARKLLELGNRTMDETLAKGVHGVIPTEKTWQLWAANLILQREANTLIGGSD